MTNDDFRQLIVNRIKTFRGRSAWARGVLQYALELANSFDFAALGESKPIRGIMLRGCCDWREYSHKGFSLLYAKPIATRLCTPTALKKTDYGRLPPNSRETWLDVQARALEQASGLVMMAIHDELYDGLGK